MREFNRRDVVIGAGVMAGLTAVGARRAAASAGAADARAVRDSIRLTGDAESAFLERMGRPSAPAAALPAGWAEEREQLTVEAQAVTKAGPDGKPFAQGLRFLCSPRAINRLTVGGEPLVARRFCFSAAEVAWAPGRGFPVYEEFCPRHDDAPKAAYRQAKAHQVVPIIDGGCYFVGSRAGDVCEALEAGQVCFDVNDSHHDDNEGFYVIDVWSWS